MIRPDPTRGAVARAELQLPDRYDALVRARRLVAFVRGVVFVAASMLALAFGFELAPYLGPLF